MATRSGNMLDWSRQITRATKRNSSNYEWALESGWRARRYEDEWRKQPEAANFRIITGYNGKKVKVYDTTFDDYIGYQKGENPDDIFNSSNEEIAERIASTKWTQEVDGVGHIGLIRYSPSRQYLEVTFTPEEGGATCVFFRVPNQVYSELRNLALSGHTVMRREGHNTVARHLLGVRFWDIVRVRGTKQQTRYAFEKTVESSVDYNGRELSRRNRIDTVQSAADEFVDRTGKAAAKRDKLKAEAQAVIDKAKSKPPTKEAQNASINKRIGEIDKALGEHRLKSPAKREADVDRMSKADRIKYRNVLSAWQRQEIALQNERKQLIKDRS